MSVDLNKSHFMVSDIIDNRMEALLRLRNGPRFAEILTEQEQEAAATLESVRNSNTVLVQDAMKEQNTLMRVMTGTLEAHRENPLLNPEARAAAQHLYAVIVDGPPGTALSAPDRVLAAKALHRDRPELEPAIAQLPATPGTPGFGQLVDAWLEVATRIGDRIHARTRQKATPTERGPRVLIGEIRSTLAMIRHSARTETRLYDDLPRDLEDQILGYADAIANRPNRPASQDAPAEAAPEVEVAEVPVPAEEASVVAENPPMPSEPESEVCDAEPESPAEPAEAEAANG